MKCLMCRDSNLVRIYYTPKQTYNRSKEKAVYECPKCGHKERF